MDMTFEQARAILADNLDVEGDGRRVAAWGWENDQVFVLAFDLRADDSDDDDGVVVDDPELDGWGTAEDIQAMREQVKLIPPGSDPWEDRPAEVPVVDKATGHLRWITPASLGDPVVPNLRPIGNLPGP